MLHKSAFARLADAATILTVANTQYANHPDRTRVVGNALETYIYWWYRTLGCTPKDAKSAGRNQKYLWAEGELGWDFDRIIAQAKLDSRFH